MGKEFLPGLLCPFQAREPRVLVSSRQFWNSLFFKVLVFPLSSFSSFRIQTFFSGTRAPSTSQGQCLHWVSIMVASGGKSLLANDMFGINYLASKSITFLHKIKKKKLPSRLESMFWAKCPDACFLENLIVINKEAMKSSAIKCFINNFNILQS